MIQYPQVKRKTEDIKMSTLKTPFRYDFVGSFLRPQALKDAKAAYQDGEITKEAFDKVVNEEITKVVAKQKELGFHVITWILCGELKVWSMKIPETVFALTQNWLCWTTPIW